MSGVGDLVAGRYRLQRFLGRGAMGVVWQATDERLHRPVALKQLLPQPGMDPARADEARARALREARIAARLHHPHAVTVHDVVVDGGLPVLVMEYVPSRSLADVLAETGTVDAVWVAGMGSQAASALSAAHAAGIVHRDVKPGNILIADDGTAKITDFGISHAAGDVAVTQNGLLAGTPAYLAPEIARGDRPTPGSDIFSLGATLYAAVEGTPPFGDDADNPIALLHVVAAGQVRPPRRAGPLAPVLTGMLRPDPAERFTSAQAGDALRAVASGRPLPATPPASHGDRGPTGTLLDAHPVPAAGYGAGQGGAGRAEAASARRWVLPAAGLLAMLLAGALLFAALGAGPEPAPKPATPEMTAADMEKAVAAYYRLLPGRHQDAWNRLGPDLRTQDRRRYRDYWDSVAGVTVISRPRSTAPDTVHVGVEIRLPDGTKIREFRQFGMLAADRRPLINTDTLLHTERITPPPPPDEQDERKGDGGKNGDVGKGGDDRRGEEDKKGEEDKTGHDN